LAAGTMGAATLATFGLVGWLGVRIDILTVFLAPMVAGVGLDYAVHVLHAHDRHVRSGARPRAAMARALEEVGPAVAVAAGTTAAGLLVLATVPAPLFARIGALGAAGVLLGFAASLTIVPAARVLLPAAAPRPRRDRLGEGFAAAGAWSLRHPRAAVALVAGPLLVAALAAATLTRVESGAADNELPADDPLLALQKRVEREYGSFQRAYLVVRGDIADAEALRALDAATLQARTLPLWRSSSSIADLVRADAATDEGLVDVALAPARRGDGLPETDAEASAAIARLWRDPLWRTLAPFTVSRDATLAVVAIQLQPWEDQHELRGLRDALQQQAAALQARLGPAYDVQPAGAPLNRAAVIGQTPEDVRVAVFGAAAASFAVLAAAWSRSWRTAAATAATVLVVLAACLLLLASIPALDAAYDALARLGAAANSASLTAMFLLAFAVTACVGLDGLVQVVHRARATRDPVEALRQTGRPVAGTALTTMAAFAPLSALYFLQSKNLAVLVALGALYCLLLTMVLAPWIARLAIPRAKAPPSGGRQEAPAKPAAQGGAPGARPRARNVPARDR
ncbi:MAG TPA: MMPL family transporter, partial [Candidatus Thermoplasmatota archaeon]|nr:MMPL family transporter [Candidatus Thermoplasmatota archaeon]